MFTKTTLSILALLICVCVTYAGVLYIEAPGNYTKEELTYPTAAITADIDSYILAEVSRIDTEVADRTVVLTVDGEPVFLNRNPVEDGANEGNDGKYLQFGVILPEYEGWSETEKESVRQHFEAIYPLACRVFGEPIACADDDNWTRTVTIRKHEFIQDWGFYNSYDDTIYLQSWPFEGDPVVVDTAHAHLTRNLLNAFRRKAPATWDQFGAGITHAAWLEIQRICAEDYGMMPMFNDTYHDAKLPDDPEFHRPYYASYDRICPSRFGRRAYPAIIEFIQSCLRRGVETRVSTVHSSGVDIEAVRAQAVKLGVELKVR